MSVYGRSENSLCKTRGLFIYYDTEVWERIGEATRRGAYTVVTWSRKHVNFITLFCHNS